MTLFCNLFMERHSYNTYYTSERLTAATLTIVNDDGADVNGATGSSSASTIHSSQFHMVDTGLCIQVLQNKPLLRA